MANSIPNPDLNSMSLSFQNISEQTKPLRHLSAIDGGVRILQALETMQQQQHHHHQQMQQHQQQMNEQTTQQFRQINQRLDTMLNQLNRLASLMDDMRRENRARYALAMQTAENQRQNCCLHI